MAIRTVVVDDNEVDLELAASYVKKLDFLQLKACCQDPLDVYPLIQSGEVDLLLCDVDMPQISGLDLIRSLESPPLVVLMTSFLDFAIEGFELEAIDYLVKPFSFVRFLKSMNKASSIMAMRAGPDAGSQPAGITSGKDHFFIRSEHRYIKILFREVLYIEALKDYVKVVTSTQSHLAALNLKVIEDNLPSGEFMRIHRSYIVNRSRIEEIGNTEIIVAGTTLPVGESYRVALFNTVVSERLIKR